MSRNPDRLLLALERAEQGWDHPTLSGGMADPDLIKIWREDAQILAAEHRRLVPASVAMDARGIETLRLSTRAENCLRSAGIDTIGKLRARTRCDLLKTKNIGCKFVREIQECLDMVGLTLAAK